MLIYVVISFKHLSFALLYREIAWSWQPCYGQNNKAFLQREIELLIYDLMKWPFSVIYEVSLHGVINEVLTHTMRLFWIALNTQRQLRTSVSAFACVAAKGKGRGGGGGGGTGEGDWAGENRFLLLQVFLQCCTKQYRSGHRVKLRCAQCNRKFCIVCRGLYWSSKDKNVLLS